MLEDVRAISVDQRGERRQILARMEARLTFELDSRPVEERHRVEVPRVEPQLRRERGFAPQPRRFVLSVRRQSREFIATRPAEIALNPFSRGDRVDLEDRRQARVPRRARVVDAEILHERCEIHVRHAGEMRRRVHRIHAARPLPIDHGDRLPGTLQQVRRRQPGNPCADDRDIHLQVALEGSEARHGRGIQPVRIAIQLSHQSRFPAGPARRKGLPYFASNQQAILAP
jgi:hypothetical protein